MKRVEPQFEYQGQAQREGFRAVQAPDLSPLYNQNIQTDAQNLNRIRESTLDSMRLQRLSSLATFSESLSESLINVAKQKSQADQEEGLMLAYTQGLPDQTVKAYDAEVEQLRQAHEGIQEVADKAQISGAPFEGVAQLRNLSGWKQYGYAIGLAQQAGIKYGAEMERALSNLPADATAADKAAALAVARSQYMAQTGLNGMNAALLNKHAWPAMREADQVMLTRWRQQDMKRQQDMMKDEAISAFEADPVNNFTTTLTELVRTGLYDRQNARTELLNRLNDTDVINAVGGSMSWDGKKTWEQLYPSEFRAARNRAMKAEIDQYDTDKSSLALEGRRWFDNVQNIWEDTPPTELEIEKAKVKMQDDFDFIDPRLERWVSRSTDYQLAKNLDRQFDQIERSNGLTVAMVNDPSVPKEVRDKYLGAAERQEKARSETPEFKQFTTQINKDLERVAGETATGSPNNVPGLELAKASAQLEYNQKFISAIKGGMPAEDAAKAAYAAVSKMIEWGRVNQQGKYAFDDVTRGFYNITKETRLSSVGWRNHSTEVNKLVVHNGDKALDRFALIPKPLLEAAVKNGSSPNWNPPEMATWISQLLGGKISPYEIMRRQAKAQGVGEIPLPPAMQEAQKTMSPEFLRLLTYKPSARRVSRAMTSLGSFNTTLVPNGYGPAIQEAAKANRIDPALLAGLLQTESAFGTNKVSPSGARGVAQFMPATAAEWGVDVNDPISSINGAAKYLRYLQDYFNGDLNKAIYAYNGGMGNIAKYNGPIPHSAENKAYLNKVLINAAKFGYGSPGGQPWANRAILNRKIAYITDGIGPTSTGPHLDVKQVGGGDFNPRELDSYVEVDLNGKRVPISQIGISDGQKEHRARGSHGIDFLTPKGSRVYLKGGVRLLGSQATEHGDRLTFQLPDGKQYTFLHGKSV